MTISPRPVFFIITVFCLLLICTALYMQHVSGLTPCYLCITQRAFIIAIGVAALIAAIHNPQKTGQRIYAFSIAPLAIAGGYFSGKQLWLQSLPEDQVPACGPPAEYLFQAFSFNDALAMLLRGDGNCAEVQWTFLSLSIPGWTMLAFISILVAGLWIGFKKLEH